MPRGIYTNIMCNDGKHPEFTPQEHQSRVVEYFLKSKYKGLVLFHRLGSGKSCSSIMTSDQMLRESKVKDVYVMTPGSLRQNFIEEYCDRCGYKPKYLRKYYTFITTNYTVGDRLPDLNDSVVIIDEVHNLINGVKNQSKHATLIYKALMKSNCRILALTGTPVFNYIWEWPLLGNLLKPGTFPNIIRGGELDPELFMQKFYMDKDGNIIPKDKRLFHNKLGGIISYFPGIGGVYYPKVIHEPPVQIRMTVPQDKKYWDVADKERKIRVIGPPKKSLLRNSPKEYFDKMEDYIMASKYIMSRFYSNFYYPPKIRSSTNPETRVEIHHIGKVRKYKYRPTGEIASSRKYFVDKLYNYRMETLKIANKLPKSNKSMKEFAKRVMTEVKDDVKKNITIENEMMNVGWVDKKFFKNHGLCDVYSRKIVALITNILKNWNAKHMVFTFFKNKAGVNIIHSVLKMCGVKTLIYSGDISDSVRRKILKVFNSEKNRYGDKYKAILVTEAGAEGINLLETQHMHILESSTREMKIQQAIGRVVRYRSHMVEGRSPMKPHEQVVHVWRYWSTSNDEPVTIVRKIKNSKTNEIKEEKTVISDKTCVDELLYNRGRVQVNSMQSFLKLLKKASVTKYDKSHDTDGKMINYNIFPVSSEMDNAYRISDERYMSNAVELPDDILDFGQLREDLVESGDEAVVK